MIHLFHGFLGKPDDLNFFKEFGEIKIYDMKVFDPDTFECAPEDMLIGYSMGGRVALKIARRINYNVKKIFILSSNPNSLSTTQREIRLNWENEVKTKMMTSSSKDFFEYWNTLGIFKNDLPIPELPLSQLQVWSKVFDKYRLSDQEDFLEDIKKNHQKVVWIVGEKDNKYIEIAKMSGLKFYTIDAGHRLFQKPELVINLIKKNKLL